MAFVEVPKRNEAKNEYSTRRRLGMTASETARRSWPTSEKTVGERADNLKALAIVAHMIISLRHLSAAMA